MSKLSHTALTDQNSIRKQKSDQKTMQRDGHLKHTI